MKVLKKKIKNTWRDSLPKNENSVIIYSPSSSSKLLWISLFCRTQRKIFWRKFVTRLFWGTIDFHSRKKKNTMEVNGAPELLCFPHSSEYLPLCSAEQRHSYRFGTTWGWVNDDRIFIFGWTIPLRLKVYRTYWQIVQQTEWQIEWWIDRTMDKTIEQ